MEKRRLYTEKEISTILKRAGERQSQKGSKVANGLTLDEIQQIAGEVGLDPSLIAEVAAELDTTEMAENGKSWAGIPSKMSVERVLPGEVTEDLWPEVVSALERSLGVIGASGQIGKTLEWTHTSKLMQYRVSFIPEGGQTKVLMHAHFSKMATAWSFVIGVGAVQGFLITLAATEFFPGSVGMGLVIGALVYMLVRFGFSSYINKKESAFHHFLSRAEKILLNSKTTSLSNSVSESQPSKEILLSQEEEQHSKEGKNENRKKVI